MRKVCLAALLFIPATAALAQDPVKDMQKTAERELKSDTSHKNGWKKGGFVSLNLAQGSSHNWSAGAEKFSLSIAGQMNLFANKKAGSWSWNNNLDLSFAMVNTTSQGVRKTDDKIDYLCQAGYSLSPKWDLTGIVNFRSQFTDGFDYDYLGKGLKRRISGLFAPAYITVAPGVTWKPTGYFTIFLSPISARWIIVTNDPYSYYYPNGVKPDLTLETPLALQYGVDPVRKVRFEAGAFASANFNKEIFKNVTWKSRLDLYSNYLKVKRADDLDDGKARPQNVDVYWTNVVAMKVNKWLSVTYNFDFIYDDDIRQFGPSGKSAGAQTRSLLGVGFSTRF